MRGTLLALRTRSVGFSYTVRRGAGRPKKGGGKKVRRAKLRAKAKAAGAKARAKNGVRAKTGRIRKYPGMSTTGARWDKKTVPKTHDALVAEIAAARAAAGGADANRPGGRKAAKAKAQAKKEKKAKAEAKRTAKAKAKAAKK